MIHVKNPLFLSHFNEIWIFSKEFRKMLTHQVSRKFTQWEPNCYMRRKDGRKESRTDRETDLTKLISSFRNFANAPKNLNTI
jgi:hypothetical protein